MSAQLSSGHTRLSSRLAWAASAIVGSSVAALFSWVERARQRRQLCSLNERMLKDIGITRAEAEGERAKAFWQS